MNFSRISLNSKRVAIDYRGELTNPKDQSSTAFTSTQKPKQEFIDALGAFKDFVRKILGFTPKWMEDATVTAVHIGEKRGRTTVQVSSMRKVPDTNAPFNFTTPLLYEPSEDGDEADGALTWPEGLDAALTKLRAAAVRYIAQDREQGDLFTGPVSASEDDGVLDDEEEELEEEEEPAGVGD